MITLKLYKFNDSIFKTQKKQNTFSEFYYKHIKKAYQKCLLDIFACSCDEIDT